MKDNNDFLLAVSNFVDNNLRTIRGLTWVLGGAGIFLIVRRIHMFSWFRSVNAIPDEFFNKSIPLRGQVKKVASDNTLSILHTPIIKTPSYKRYLMQHAAGQNTEPSKVYLPINLSGIAFRPGGREWLAHHVIGTRIQLVPLRVNSQKQLDSIAYIKNKGWLKRRKCVNEELVFQGVAVTDPCLDLQGNRLYNQMFAKLLKAEVIAEKKGRGIWVNPSWSERAKETLSSVVERVKQTVSSIRKSKRES